MHDPESLPRRGSATARLVLPAVLAFLIQTPFAVFLAARAGWSLDGALAVLAAIAGPVALLGSRRWPGPVVVVCAAAATLGLVVGAGAGFGPPPVALLLAIVLAIVRGARVWALAALAATWTAILVLLAVGGTAVHPPRIVAFGVGLLIAVGAGEFARGRRERYERFRSGLREQRQSAEQAERVRIARELHDVLAHSLSSINVQAGMGLHLIETRPEKAAEALAAIKAASKDALDEVRGVIGVLRADDDAPRRPEPGLDGLDALAEPLRASGITVEVRDDLADQPSAAVQLALYRIAQESLTNVLRHAEARRVEVSVAPHEDGVELVIIDDGHGGHPSPGGRGLLGMAERATLLGGTFEAGPAGSGGFRVRAILPKGNR